MQTRFSRIKNTLIVAPDGDLTSFRVKDFAKLVTDEADQQDFENLLIDLEHCKTIDSLGFGSLAYLFSYFSSRRTRLALCNMEPRIKKHLRLLRLDDMMSVYPTKFEALQELEAAPSTGENGAFK